VTSPTLGLKINLRWPGITTAQLLGDTRDKTLEPLWAFRNSAANQKTPLLVLHYSWFIIPFLSSPVSNNAPLHTPQLFQALATQSINVSLSLGPRQLTTTATGAMGIMTIAESPIARLQWTLVARGFSPNPPSGPQDKMHNHPTLLFSWFCTICAVVLIVMRLMGRLTRSRKLFPEDKVMAWSMVPLLARMALVHLVMLWGTNNVNLANALSAADIRHRRVGSRLVLASRICYAML
jgi:hypothetical protein